jgi:hypothetical protein
MLTHHKRTVSVWRPTKEVAVAIAPGLRQIARLDLKPALDAATAPRPQGIAALHCRTHQKKVEGERNCMSKTRVFIIVLFASVFLLNGCATSRGLVSLTTPTSDKAAPSNGMEIYIRSVVDKRVFEADPKSPDIPSLDPSEPQNEDIKRRAIARKRNTFGKGLGDILLNEGQTVVSVISDSLRQAFIEEGYTVIGNGSNLAKNSRIVDVEITNFGRG